MKTCPRSVAPLMPLNETADTRPRPACVQRLIVRNGSADLEPGTSVVKPPRGCDGSASWSVVCSAYSAAPCVRLPKPKAGLASWSRLRRPAQYWFCVSRCTHSGVFGAGLPAGATQDMSTSATGAAAAGGATAAHTLSAHASARRRTTMLSLLGSLESGTAGPACSPTTTASGTCVLRHRPADPLRRHLALGAERLGEVADAQLLEHPRDL